ncbi:hypothetical protein [Salinigranum sp.]|uniref:hypothetical protein n=1 Tax=Salinigranum sp. TaxID=1966351 RepID=UPI003568C23D
MTYQTTVGWSLLTSGIVTLILYVLPGDSLWWGVGLLIAGLIILYVRRDDVSDAVGAVT